jgi:SAM-dependent methyltransferase
MLAYRGYARLRQWFVRNQLARRIAGAGLLPLANVLRKLDKSVLSAQGKDVRARHEFNVMAAKGGGEHMEHDHLPLMEVAIEKMDLSPDDRLLDIGCGEGWASLLVRSRLGDSCRVLGVDIADEFVRRANAKSENFPNVNFLQGTADRIPSADAAFTKVLSFSSFYYFPDQEAALKEIRRVVAPSGELFILTCLYKDRTDWNEQEDGINWEERAGTSLHVFSAKEYEALLTATGWTDAHTEEIVLENPPDPHHSRALLISGRRP